MKKQLPAYFGLSEEEEEACFLVVFMKLSRTLSRANTNPNAAFSEHGSALLLWIATTTSIFHGQRSLGHAHVYVYVSLIRFLS
jgi:hypothetical protein